MAEADADTSHVAIDIVDVDAGRSNSCPVCMEAPEWVAAGPCGHREVCLGCAVRLRFFENDRRCCICRQLCPAVVVTRVVDGGGGGDQQQTVRKASRWAGAYDWYHGGMGAYFDDEEQYEAVRKACFLKPLSPPVEAASEVEQTRAPEQQVSWFVFDIVCAGMFGASAGIPIAVICLKHMYQKVILFLELGLFWSTVAFWLKTSNDESA
ncbi:hypothetical protein HU200_042155 [Digitaria exilis]|uniref:RING-type domain-containing protein n=1 Tax=Digitaria exilis TaxID=1010633 RepID=A0A835EF15_9POAL|nr:hypothetical protein HU200_042155 [Digitaria exilis]